MRGKRIKLIGRCCDFNGIAALRPLFAPCPISLNHRTSENPKVALSTSLLVMKQLCLISPRSTQKISIKESSIQITQLWLLSVYFLSLPDACYSPTFLESLLSLITCLTPPNGVLTENRAKKPPLRLSPWRW